MQRLYEFCQRIADESGWEFDGKRLEMPVGAGGRRHRINLARKRNGDYVLTCVVLGSATVTDSKAKWRELARLAWRRNAEQELVTFAFDDSHRLVGQVRHPADHLDFEEFELYVRTLARECDRFEYLLTGQDVY